MKSNYIIGSIALVIFGISELFLLSWLGLWEGLVLVPFGAGCAVTGAAGILILKARREPKEAKSE